MLATGTDTCTLSPGHSRPPAGRARPLLRGGDHDVDDRVLDLRVRVQVAREPRQEALEPAVREDGLRMRTKPVAEQQGDALVGGPDDAHVKIDPFRPRRGSRPEALRPSAWVVIEPGRDVIPVDPPADQPGAGDPAPASRRDPG